MISRLLTFFPRYLEKIVLLLAITLSIGSFVYYYHAGLITAYGDSRAHLDIARRVVDSLSPGAAQLGGYWLPLLHILMLPTIWNDFMWQSGISGSIPNMLAFVVAVVLMYRLVLYITKDKFSALIGASVLLFNPNLLYMQATPMTESLFIMTIVGFMYFFYRWFQEKKVPDLIVAALFLVLCSLNRYEGWGLVIAANALMIWYWIQNKFDRKVEGAMVAFASLSFLGVFIWLLWGAVIFQDPLEFIHNSWMNSGKQEVAFEVSKNWTGVGNMQDAAISNIYAIFYTSGFLLSTLSFIFFIFYLFKNFRDLLKSEYWVPIILFVPLIFDFLTVYFGKIPIEVPGVSQMQPELIFNIRYALFSLPVIAIFISISNTKKIFKVIVALFIILNYGYFFLKEDEIIVLQDMSVDIANDDEGSRDLKWFKENYDGGLILMSAGSNDGLIFQIGIDQKNFISEGSYKYWNESLKDPSMYASWVFMSSGLIKDSFTGNFSKDSIRNGINMDILMKKFRIEKKNDKFIIFKKIEDN